MNQGKRILLAAGILALLAAPAFAGAQEQAPSTGPVLPIGGLFGLTPDGTLALMTLLSGRVVKSNVEWIKKKLGLEGGLKAGLANAAVSIGLTLYYLLAITHHFTWWGLAGYSLALFGWSSGLYTIDPPTEPWRRSLEGRRKKERSERG
jgi:hypothetical protein